MKKTTLFVLLGFVALLGAVLFMEYRPKPAEADALTIPGFLDEGETAAKATTDLKDPGFTKVVIERGADKLVLEKDGDAWSMTEPRRARVEDFKVKQMFVPLQTPSESLFSKEAKDEDLPLYGLGPDEATSVEITRDGKVFTSFVVGAAEKSEDPEAGADEVDTWVKQKGSSRVYRIGGKDLHKPFAVKANDLRDKKLFDFEKDDIRKVTLLNPDNASDPEIVLVNRAPEKPAGAEEPKGDVKPSQPADWEFEKPAGVKLGDPSGLLGSIAGLRAAEFVSASDEGAKATGLGEGDKPFVVKVALGGGKEVTLRIGATEGNNTYAELAGDDERIKIAKYSADTLRKTVPDLREKKVLGLKKEDVVGVIFQKTGVELSRTGNDWTMDKPPGYSAGKDAVDTLLRDIETFAITEFVSPVPGVEETGLDPATAAHVIIKTTGGDKELLFGTEEDSKVWVQQIGSPEVWRVSSYTAKKLDKGPDDLRDRQVFTFDRGDVAKLELGKKGETVTLERDATETDDSKAWKVVSPEEVAPKGQTVATIITTLANLKAKSFITGKQFAEVGLTDGAFTVKLTLKNGQSRELLLSDQQYQGETYAVAPSETGWQRQLFTVNQYQAKNLTKTLKDLTE